jgi:hypothetical protein
MQMRDPFVSFMQYERNRNPVKLFSLLEGEKKEGVCHEEHRFLLRYRY